MMAQMNGQIEAKLLNADSIELEQYWNTIKLYFWRIIGLSALVTLLVTLIVLSLTPQYKASATLLIESKQANVLSIEEVYGLDANRKEYFQTQYEILRSRQIAQAVVDKLGLDEQVGFSLRPAGEQGSVSGFKQWLRELLPFLPQKAVMPSSEEAQLKARKDFAVNVLMQNLQISPITNTQLVEITYIHQDPILAAAIANTVGDVYIESYLQAKFDMTAKATSWLNESLQGLKQKLDTAEKKLAEFYDQERLVNIDGVVGLASEKLQKLSSQLIEAQVNFKRNESIYLQVNSQSISFDELANLPEVINHPAIQSVKRSELISESKVSELSKVYGPKHPKMIAANAELQSIRSSLHNQIKSLLAGINTEYKTAQTKYQDLQDEVEIAKQDFRRLSTLENTSRALQREVDINQQLYDSFFTRLKETNELGGFESANARLLDHATPPNSAAKPKKALIIAAAFIISCAFGVFLALVLDALNSGIRSVDDVERKLTQRMLGIIPWQSHRKQKDLPIRHFFDTKHHTFSESVRTLRTSLQLLNIDKPARTILITSSVPKEGKSTVAINLAFAMAQLSKVLLIDTDLRRPSLAKQFELPGFQPGISNLISGTHSLDECLVKDEYSGVDLICAGTIPPNPQELLSSNQFALLIKQFEGLYDHIIVDSAPTQAVSDAIVVSKVCDSVIYVVKADSTSHKIINIGLSRFMQMGLRVDGVVLNQVDLKKAKKTGQYTGFYDQYGYHSDSMEYKKA